MHVKRSREGDTSRTGNKRGFFTCGGTSSGLGKLMTPHPLLAKLASAAAGSG